eukprot:CAMPEP_0197048182 /NCGR_PEP_ID=MMETSP1384-20130603/23581_1 /TAXON_ID=29189 /ORGANISM="Ammonia sp." /LENGTH=398 /DNA_ID=CAMNT_0042480275 /DNA_START=248 /DNA_END=1444 /DNA_ORIENTATION=-
MNHRHYHASCTHHKRTLLFLLLCLVMLPTLCVSSSDYYNLLGISRQSSQREIKKAFRRLATQYHPDKNPGDEEAHQKFVEINRAYEVLSDEDKRRVYNQYGEEGVKEHEKNQAAKSGRRGGGGIFDMFFNQGQGGDDDAEDKRGEDIEADIWLHLDEIYKGHIYDLSIFRQVLCPHCFGSGADSDDAIYECRKCGGSGSIMERRQIGIGFVQQIQKTCPKCNGQGKIVKQECRVCGGRGVHEGSHTYWVEIQRGTPDGYKLLLENEGDERADSKGGHVSFHVRTFKNMDRRTTGFQRDEENINDLHYFVKINLLQALVGYNINITHLDGHVVNIENLAKREEDDSHVTKPLSIRTIEGEGMPIVGTFPTKFGDLHVHFEVVFPETLTQEQKIGIERLL